MWDSKLANVLSSQVVRYFYIQQEYVCVKDELCLKKGFCKCVNQVEALGYNPSELCSQS